MESSVDYARYQIMLTMSDIASQAGVSRTAVSHVLSGQKTESIRISEMTRQRILDVAADLGYRPNQLARSVASGKSRMIGYLVSEPRYEPYWNTIVGALAEAEELGFTLKVFSVTDKTLAERVRQCVELRLSGLIVRVNNDKTLIFNEANRAQIPTVIVDEGAPQPFGVRVASDDSEGCRAVIEHLVGLGHRKIGFISSGFPLLNDEIEDVGTVREGFYRQEMAQRELEIPAGYVTHDSVFVYGESVRDHLDGSTAIEATQQLLLHPAGRPTAIFCWRDETAMFAVQACRARGLRVPEDISIVGFSNLMSSRLFDPALTTVQSPWDEMGRVAVRQLNQQTDQRFDASPSVHLIKSSLIVRQSSGPVPQ